MLKNLTIEEIDLEILRLQNQRKNLIEQSKSKPIFFTQTQQRKIIVIGGQGQLGRLFVQAFKTAGYWVEAFEKDDWELSQAALKSHFSEVDLVLVAVPIGITCEVIKRLNFLPKNCILADITSIKNKPVEQMLIVHAGPVVGLHPMFGPDVKSFNHQTIVVCHGRDNLGCEWLIQQLTDWQANVYLSESQKHDETMAIVQVLRHFSTVVYGTHLASENICLEDILAMSSPIYRLELAMVGRLFAQDVDLYTEIIFANPDNIEMMQRYITQFDTLLKTLKAQNKDAFKQHFIQTHSWFGDYADKFLNESRQMLATAKYD